MIKILLIVFLHFGVASLLQAQKDTLIGWTQVLLIPYEEEAYIFEAKLDLPLPREKFLKSISIKHDFIKKTKDGLIRECVDSMRYYGGNCFKITYYDNVPLIWGRGQEFPDQMRGELYALDADEIKEVRRLMKNDLYPEDAEQNARKTKKNGEVSYDINIVLQYGGESKIAFIFPKINFLRKRHFKTLKPYYGFEVGPHIHLLGPYGSISAIVGLEKSIFNFETSLSRFHFGAIPNAENGFTGPFRQTLCNLKVGAGIEGVRIKVGRSFLLNEYIPEGQERIPFLDIGKFNSGIWSFELQFGGSF